MAEYAAAGEGCWRLVQSHCPIGVAAKHCLQLCALEPRLFRAILGEDVSIERTEHIQEGGRRCVYEIRQGASSKPD